MDREQVKAMIDQGIEPKVIADALGCHPDSVRRLLRKMEIKLGDKGKRISPEHRAHALRMVEDGVPYVWIGETIDANALKMPTLKWMAEAVAKRRASGGDFEKAVWAAIRRNPTLLKYHREFSPRKEEAEDEADPV